ncbi:MAG TPA: hypothetical protein VLF59_05395 [Candidatus Saccharimonadales bacterium]|nr:hypothetical protein [Candidatus Saccharimonadales bacterium]
MARTRIAYALLLAALFVPNLGSHASAAPKNENGLLITPLRQYLKGDAGSAVPSTFTVANLTNTPLTVAFSVKQFSVADYTYDYTFATPADNWLSLSEQAATLQPHQSHTVSYSISIPKGSAPGSHYYTLFASAKLTSQSVSSTVQAADVLYLTVNGALTSVSHLQASSIKWITFGSSIPFTLEPVNTGNAYSFVYVGSQLHGLFVRPPVTSVGHMLIPGKVRRITGSIPSPVLPGVYDAQYGYKSDSGWIIQESHLVVYIPPWFIAFLLAAFLVTGRFWRRRKRTNTDGTPTEADTAT